MRASLVSIAVPIEFAGALVIIGHVLGATYSLYTTRSIEKARFTVATGAIAGLDFKTAATLLKTPELSSWDQVGVFIAILSVRVFLKHVLAVDRGR
jgi:uncharacterized membrane protein